MGRRARQAASPVAEPPCSHRAAAAAVVVAQGAADAEVMVRRSRIAPCVTCGLCGGFLRDAAAIAECLHPFCRECIVEEFTDKTINRCPKCDIDLGCNPLKKLRADHSLQRIRSLIFPAKRRKMEEISSLQPPFFPLPSPSNQAHEVDHPAKKADAHLMVEPTNAETETEADEGHVVHFQEFEREHHGTLDKQAATQERKEFTDEVDPWIIAAERSWTSMTTDEEWSTEGWMTTAQEWNTEGCRNELIKQVYPWTVGIDSSKTRMTAEGWTRWTAAEEQSTEGCTNELTNEVDPWTVAVERSKTRMTTERWRTRRTTAEERSMEGCRNELTKEVDPWIVIVESSKTRMTTDGWRTTWTAAEEQSTEGCRNELTNEVDPWTVAVKRSKTRMTTDEGWITDGWTAAVKEHVSSLTTQVEANCGRARSLEDEVRRLHRELEAARATASEADARRSVAEQKMMEAERAAEIMARAFDRARDNMKEYGLLPVDLPPDWSVAEFAAGFGHVVADCLDRLRDDLTDRTVEVVRDATTVTAEYVLAYCLSHDPSFRMEMVLEGIVAADEVEEHALLGRARETALRFAREMVQVDMVPRAGGDGADGERGSA